MCFEIKTINKQTNTPIASFWLITRALWLRTETSLAARSFRTPRRLHEVSDERHVSLRQVTRDLRTLHPIRSVYLNKHRTGTLQGLLYSCIYIFLLSCGCKSRDIRLASDTNYRSLYAPLSCFNHSIHKSDQYCFSPRDTHTLSSTQVRRIRQFN